jgi:choline-glycine betaine transporter
MRNRMMTVVLIALIFVCLSLLLMASYAKKIRFRFQKVSRGPLKRVKAEEIEKTKKVEMRDTEAYQAEEAKRQARLQEPKKA